MIDSMLKFQCGRNQSKQLAPWTQWLLSAGRDGRIVLWKLMDGVLVSRGAHPEVKTFEKISLQVQMEKEFEKRRLERERRLEAVQQRRAAKARLEEEKRQKEVASNEPG